MHQRSLEHKKRGPTGLTKRPFVCFFVGGVLGYVRIIHGNWKKDLIRLWIWTNYSDLTRPGPPKGGQGREIPLFHENLGW